MSLVLSILLLILAIAGSLLLVALLIPLQAKARGAWRDGKPVGRAVVRWGWGLVSIRIRPPVGATLHILGIRVRRLEPGGKKRDEKKEQEKEKKDQKGKGRGLRWLLGNRRLLLHLAGRMLGLFHLRGTVEGEVGLDDPADTAWLRLLVLSATGRMRGLDLSLVFDFTGEVLRVNGNLRSWLWPAQVVIVAIGLLLRRDVRRLLWARA